MDNGLRRLNQITEAVQIIFYVGSKYTVAKRTPYIAGNEEISVATVFSDQCLPNFVKPMTMVFLT